MWRDGYWPRQSYPIPYDHEATASVSTTALALKSEKWGGLTEKSGSAQVGSWSISGVNRNNSDIGKNPGSLTLYWKLTDSEGTRTVSLYKDSGFASLVAQGTSSGDGTATLAAQNSSGIYGSVAVTYTVDDTDVGNQIIISPRAVQAKITIDLNAVRYWVDNTVPTATSDGHICWGSATTTGLIELNSCEEIMNFRIIRDTADAKMSVTYYE